MTSYGFWKTCGVSSPGFCNSTLMAASASTEAEFKAFGVMLIALTAVALKFIL